jgi:hypothetical protein
MMETEAIAEALGGRNVEEIQRVHFSSPDDVLNYALAALREKEHSAVSMPGAAANSVPDVTGKNLVQLFAESPLAGADLDFERDRDLGRDIDRASSLTPIFSRN